MSGTRGTVRGRPLATELFAVAAAGSGSSEPVVPPAEVMIFPYGDNFDNGWAAGPQTIDRAYGEQIAANFRANVTQVGVPLDIEHEQGPAPGWVTGVEAREDGVYAQVDWTPLGQQLVGDRVYRYVSPEWFLQWQRGIDGQVFDRVLTRLSLTNKPFFSNLPALAEGQQCPGEACILRAEGPRILGGITMPEQTPNPNPETTAAGGTPAPRAEALAAETAAPRDPALTALQAELNTERQAREALQAQVAAGQMRERRGGLIVELRDRVGSAGRMLPPAWAETAADILLCVPETAVTVMTASVAGETPAPRETTQHRQAVEFLATVLGSAAPLAGEHGRNLQPMPPADTPEAKATELHRAAKALQAEKADLSYEAACMAVLEKRPELV